MKDTHSNISYSTKPPSSAIWHRRITEGYGAERSARSAKRVHRKCHAPAGGVPQRGCVASITYAP